MARPREYDEDTRQALLDAASRRLAVGGPDALTLRAVAADVGATTSAIYALFGSKPDLLRAVFRTAFEGLADELAQVEPSSEPLLDLYELAMAYRRHAKSRPSLYLVMFASDTAAAADLSPDDAEVAAATLDRLRTGVRRCQEAALLPGTDPEALTLQLWALVHGLAMLEIRGALGDEVAAGKHWHEALVAIAAGYATGSS